MAAASDRRFARGAITAWGHARFPLSDAASVRKSLTTADKNPIAIKHIKHSDDQTIAGMLALLTAAKRLPDGTSFNTWAVIGAPRFLGRREVALTANQYLKDPAWGVSPNIIPNHSLHSLSGTASVVLGAQGPNFGVGGGPDALREGLLAALSLNQQSIAPGLWLLLSQYDPDPIPDEMGVATNQCTVWALALAIQPTDGLFEIQIRGDLQADSSPVLTIPRLVEFLDQAPTSPLQAAIPGIGAVEIAASTVIPCETR